MDLDFEVDNISITVPGLIGSKARNILKKCLYDEMLGRFRTMTEDLMKYENNPDKLKEDQLKRETAKKLTSNVVKEKVVEQEQILRQQIQEEKANKMKVGN